VERQLVAIAKAPAPVLLFEPLLDLARAAVGVQLAA